MHYVVLLVMAPSLTFCGYGPHQLIFCVTIGSITVLSGISTLTGHHHDAHADGQIALILAGYLLLSNLLLINLLIAMFNQTVGTCVHTSRVLTLPKASFA